MTATATNPSKSSTSPPTSFENGASENLPPVPTVGKRDRKSAIPVDAVPYFAYFSNMNPSTFGPDARNRFRRCPILQARTAVLLSHQLVFDAAGTNPIEPVFANIRAVETSAGQSVHGVLFWISPSDFRRLAASEGIINPDLSFDSTAGIFDNLRLPLPIPIPPPPATRIITVTVDTVDPDTGLNEQVRARTFEFPHLVPQWAGIRPSNRYVKLGLDGAEYWGVDRTSLDNAIDRVYGKPRRHPLDRPNPEEQFGSPGIEIFSPYTAIKATEGAERIKQVSIATLDETNNALRLVQLSNGEQGNRQGLYFLPGIDGQGKSILGQVSDIDAEGEYCVKSVVYPRGNRQSLEEMASSVLELIASDSKGKRVSLIAESMGGVVSIITVLENVQRKRDLVDLPTIDIDLMLIINPATSYYRSGPRELWDFLIGLGLTEDMYRFLLPPILLPFLIDIGSVSTGVTPEILPRLVNIVRSVGSLSDSLPKDAMQHRINLLATQKISEARLKLLSEAPHAPRFVALVSTTNDNLLPSFSESRRLQRAIPGLYRSVIPFGGHGPFLDPRLSLASFLRPFLPSRILDGTAAMPSSVERRLQVQPTTAKTTDDRLFRRQAALRKRYQSRRMANDDSIGAGNKIIRKRMQLSPDNTIELGRRMTQGEIDEFVKYSKSVFDRFDPVFVGEENIPAYSSRPILFIANHTIIGWLDGLFPCIRLLTTRRMLLRVFGHPILFQSDILGFPLIGVESLPTDRLVQYGFSPVTPTHVLASLSRGEWGIMFPGGAREALKSRSDKKYAVKWPEDPEFIRACSLFGASIIPVSLIGTEDLAEIIADPSETRVWAESIGKVLTRNKDFEMTDVTKETDVRMWKRGPDDKSDTPLVPPLLVPSAKSGPREERVYVRFGKPIDIPPECLDDKAMTNSYYKQVRGAVEEGIELLSQRKLKDMYIPRWRRDQFKREFGKEISPPCAPAWSWMRGDDSYLDDDNQPPS